jgi:hypothetical protein
MVSTDRWLHSGQVSVDSNCISGLSLDCGSPRYLIAEREVAWNHEFSRNRDSLRRPGVSDRCGGSYSAGTRLHGHWRYCDAESETERSPSPLRDDLFLVFGRGLPDCIQPGCGALGSGLPLVYPGSLVPRRGLSGPSGPAAALAVLGQTAHHGNGIVLRFAVDRFLRGQRQEPAALERAASHCVLATAGSYRDSPYPPRFVVASAGASAGHSLVGRLSRHSLFLLF